MAREVGLISVIGNMFGGKTAETIRLANIEKEMGRKIQAFKPGIDNRYGNSYLKTHDKAEFPAVSVKDVGEIRSLIREDTDVLVIEEAQFFDEELYDLVMEEKEKRMVILNGLQVNFRGEPFYLRKKGSLRPSQKFRVMDIAVMGKIITAYPDCLFRENYNGDEYRCRAEAIFPQRFTKNESLAPYANPEIVIGAGDIYSPRCVNHFAKPLPEGKFMYHSEEHTQEDLKKDHPEVFKK